MARELFAPAAVVMLIPFEGARVWPGRPRDLTRVNPRHAHPFYWGGFVAAGNWR
jgi:CHAT domain-containing protein